MAEQLDSAQPAEAQTKSDPLADKSYELMLKGRFFKKTINYRVTFPSKRTL